MRATIDCGLWTCGGDDVQNFSMDTLADRLRAAVAASDFTKHGLEVRLDAEGLKGRNFIGRVYAGVHDSNVRTWVRLAEMLDVSLEWLMTGRKPEPQSSDLSDDQRLILMLAARMGEREALARLARFDADRDAGPEVGDLSPRGGSPRRRKSQ